MKENYWIHHNLNKEDIKVPFYDFYKDRMRVLTEKEFNFKITYTKFTGTRGLFLGLSLLGLTYLTRDIGKDDPGMKTVNTFCYISSALSVLVGGKKTYDYYNHRNDIRPASEEEAFYKYIVDEKSEEKKDG